MHQNNCKATEETFWVSEKKIETLNKKLKYVSPLPEVQNETQLWPGDCLPCYFPFLICVLFVVYIIIINQSECLLLLSHKRDQPISVRHVWVIIPTCGLVITYSWHKCVLHVTNSWSTCNQIVLHLWLYYHTLLTSLWPTCGPLVVLLLLTLACNCIHKKLSWKLPKIFLKIVWNFL